METEVVPTPATGDGHGAKSYWIGERPQRPPTGRPIGWIVLAIGVAAVVLCAVYLVILTADVDPDDPGAADIAFFFGPILAIVDAIVISTLLAVLARLRLIPLTVGRAATALGAGVLLGPVIDFTVVAVGASALDAAHSGLADATVSCLLPAICAVGVTLLTAFARRPRRSAHGRVIPS